MLESNLRAVNLYTSHEGLILDYEEALTQPTENYGVSCASMTFSSFMRSFLTNVCR